MRAHDFGIGAVRTVIKMNLLTGGRHAQRIPAHEAVRNHRCDPFMHGALRGFANDPSEEGLGETTAHVVGKMQESVATGISSMERSNCVAALLETSNLLANESFHPSESLRWFSGQNENFCSQLLHSASFEQFVLRPTGK